MHVHHPEETGKTTVLPSPLWTQSSRYVQNAKPYSGKAKKNDRCLLTA